MTTGTKTGISPGPTRRYRVSFHDFWYGRISFHRVVESAVGITDAQIKAREDVVMPDYVIADSVTLLDDDRGVGDRFRKVWDHMMTGDWPEPPLIQKLVRRHAEEVYGSGALYGDFGVYGSYGPESGSQFRPDIVPTVDDILTAIRNAGCDAGEARHHVAKCPELADLLLNPGQLADCRDTRPLQSIVAHLADLTGHSTHRIYDTLRADARAMRDTGQVIDRVIGDPLGKRATDRTDPPLTPGQGGATLVDGRADGGDRTDAANGDQTK